MSSGARATDFERRFREEVRAGRPPDRLSRFSPDEVERFYSQVVEGADGHTFWIGARTGFLHNDGRRRSPERWVWERTHKALTSHEPVVRTCREPRCVTLEHLALGDWGSSRRRYTDQALLGYLQVGALRLGRAPTRELWRQRGYRPNGDVIAHRFGGWDTALRRAGLKR